jgi:hypothetical protein
MPAGDEPSLATVAATVGPTGVPVVAVVEDDSWYSDPTFLLQVWRRRDAGLLRLLNARNLAQIKEEFDREEAATGRAGLGVVDFVRIMLSLLSRAGSGSDREELCIQIIELFANIDVNGDRNMEWEEFLNYIVEIGYGSGNTGSTG